MIQMPKFLLVSATLVASLASMAAGQPYSGVVSVDTAEALPGEHIGVGVRLSSNDVPISGLIIPLKFSSPDLTIDSVSFAGTILPSDFDAHAVVDNVSGKVTIAYLSHFTDPIPGLTATEGLIGVIYMSVSPGASLGTVAIDAVNIDSAATDGGPAAHLWRKVHATDQSGTVTLLPGYRGGAVAIKSTTAAGDGGEPVELPTSLSLSQNYPNPFNPVTVIEFTLPHSGPAKLELFNILGQKAQTLVDGHLPAGNHQVEFNGADLPSGIYFYRLTHNAATLTRKMTLIK